ncbi:scavenger receptor cysteine-rich domain-containing group B protein-like [Crassostrea virginica]
MHASFLHAVICFYSSGASFEAASVYGEASGTIWLDDLVCTGSETSITQCQSNGWGVHNCGHSEDVAISCSSAPSTVSVRLVGGTMSRGRVEILYNNEWGTICNDAFTVQSAGVLCHMLGFSRSVLSIWHLRIQITGISFHML